MAEVLGDPHPAEDPGGSRRIPEDPGGSREDPGGRSGDPHPWSTFLFKAMSTGTHRDHQWPTISQVLLAPSYYTSSGSEMLQLWGVLTFNPICLKRARSGQGRHHWLVEAWRISQDPNPSWAPGRIGGAKVLHHLRLVLGSRLAGL